MRTILTGTLLFLLVSLSAQTTVYIDPSASANGVGTITNPYNGSTFNVQYGQPWTSNTTYLFKRGTTFTPNYGIGIIAKNDVFIGAYGVGLAPKITSTSVPFDLGSSYNITIRDLDVFGSNYNKTTEVGPLCLIKMNGSSPTGYNNMKILNCKLHGANWGIRAVVGVDQIKVDSCEIYNTLDDGMFYQGATNCELANTYIHDVNEKWYNIQTQEHAGGDCAQFDGNVKGLNGLYIHNNIMDHSSTGLKFCLIYEGIKAGDIIRIENNTFIRGTTAGPEQGLYISGEDHTTIFKNNTITNAGAIAYWSTAPQTNSIFSGNTITNAERGFELYQTNNVKVTGNYFNNTTTAIEHENHAYGLTVSGNTFNLISGQKICNLHASSGQTLAGITWGANIYPSAVVTATFGLTSYSLTNWLSYTGGTIETPPADTVIVTPPANDLCNIFCDTLKKLNAKITTYSNQVVNLTTVNTLLLNKEISYKDTINVVRISNNTLKNQMNIKSDSILLLKGIIYGVQNLTKPVK